MSRKAKTPDKGVLSDGAFSVIYHVLIVSRALHTDPDAHQIVGKQFGLNALIIRDEGYVFDGLINGAGRQRCQRGDPGQNAGHFGLLRGDLCLGACLGACA